MKTRQINLSTIEEETEQKKIPEKETVSKKARIGMKIKKTKDSLLKKRTKKRRLKKRPSKAFIISFFFLAIIVTTIVALLVNYIVLPARRINKSVNTIQDNLYEILSDLESKDLTGLETNVNNIQTELANISTEIDRYEFLSRSKYTRGYYENLQVTRDILNQTDTLLVKALPKFQGLLETTGFKVEEGSQPVASSETDDESAFSMIIKDIPQYIDLYEEMEPDIINIFADVKRLDPEYIPDIPEYGVKAKYEKSLYYIDKYPDTSTKIKDFLRKVPDLMGAGKETNYMIILQNETEMRASGGLLTAVGNATIADGEIGNMKNLKDMWDLQYYMWQLQKDGLIYEMPYYNIYGQLYLMNTGCGGSESRAQDVGMYPDLHTSMDMFKDYYDTANLYDPESYPDYDHIVIFDHHSGEMIINLIEPLQVEGFGEVTSENLFDFIKAESDNADKYQGVDFSNRKSVIGEVANAAKGKFFDLPLDQMPNVINTIVSLFQGKDIAFYTKDTEMQNYFDEYGLSGRQAYNFDGDFFHLNEAQNCSLKLNKFMRDKVTMNISIEDDGRISNSVNVHWWQPQVWNESLSKYYDSTLRFSYRAWVRLFTPPGSYDFESDGYEQSGYLDYWPEEYYDEVANKEVSDNIIQFDHRRFSDAEAYPEHDLNVSYRVSDNINYLQQGSYKLLIQKHPGKSWDDGFEEYDINITYKGTTTNVKFQLDRDKILVFKGGIISVDNYDKSLDWIVDLADSLPFDKLDKN